MEINNIATCKKINKGNINTRYINGIAQVGVISIVNALEIQWSCLKAATYLQILKSHEHDTTATWANTEELST